MVGRRLRRAGQDALQGTSAGPGCSASLPLCLEWDEGLAKEPARGLPALPGSEQGAARPGQEAGSSELRGIPCTGRAKITTRLTEGELCTSTRRLF